jgi:hypothetical protein
MIDGVTSSSGVFWRDFVKHLIVNNIGVIDDVVAFGDIQK